MLYKKGDFKYANTSNYLPLSGKVLLGHLGGNVT
jgi:hypothetical protein